CRTFALRNQGSLVTILPFPVASVHGRTVMRVVFLSGNARPADAIGNQIAEKAAFFLERGADVRVYVEEARPLHPALTSLASALDADRMPAEAAQALAAADLIIA